MTNNFIAWGPIFLMAILVIAGIFFADRQSRIGKIEHDASGQLPAVTTLSNGKWRMTVPNLMGGPVLEFGKEISAPQLLAPEDQAQVTMRAQSIQAIRSLPQGQQGQAHQIAQTAFGNKTTVRAVEIVKELPAELGEVVDDVEQDLWDGAK